MELKRKKNISPVLNPKVLPVKQKTEEEKERALYNQCKNTLDNNTDTIVELALENPKMLYLIKVNQLYRLDGHKSFNAFLKQYPKLGKTQAYTYIKIIKAIEDGIIDENHVVQNGYRRTIAFINNARQNGNLEQIQNKKFLHFGFDTPDIYMTCKQNKDFVEFLLKRIISEQDLFNKFMNEFTSLKNNQKKS
ncbi:hypothetical protein DB313_05570 (plasmid) [Borrelia turcica IST7]|uniref:Plasmid partition protein putative N-terminal domain-containing protein n=1 Tax=Borrelia turcica IST7 TaxID=1104446 RepID=A0A386PPP4_9SPIR|nr:chromosome replication/partitioning protein [Borrelia turcica]AYE36965.1 hypothetical protein DB313_05570 [Borrelia turcica IST7]